MILCRREERVKMTGQKQNGADQDVKGRTAKRKAALVLDLIKGTSTVAQAAKTYDIVTAEIEKTRSLIVFDL